MASIIPNGMLPSRTSLSDLGFEVLSLFQCLQTAETEEVSQTQITASITTEAERFELWAVNLGLFVAGHGSLDYRLREADRLAQTIRRFLRELLESLGDGKTYLARTPNL